MNLFKQLGPRLIGAALLYSSIASATAADRAKALELVLASRVDAPLLGTFKEGIRARLKGLTPEQLKCYLDLPSDSFQDAAVSYLARLLSDAELTQGLAFFATPVGKTMAKVYDGETSSPTRMELSQEEYAQHEAFLATRPGSELLIPNNLLQSPEAKKQFDQLFAKKWRKCGGPAN